MIVQKIIEKAKQKQAQSVQAILQSEEKSDVNFENDRLKSAENSQRTDIQVRVIKDGRVGISSTTDPDDVDGVVRRALEAAEFGAPATYELPGAQTLPAVKTFDPDLLNLKKPEMIRLGQNMMEMIKAYNPEILAAAGLSASVKKIEFANSNGVEYSSEHTDYQVGAGGSLVRGTDILYAGENLAQKQRLIDPEDIAVRAIEYFRLAERLAPVESGDMPVIFTPAGLSALLLGLMEGVDGKNVLLGDSPLGGKLGEAIADPRFTLLDDPLLDYAANSNAFDDEGVARKVTPLVEDGILKNFIYDLDTAARSGKQPSGHGRRRRPTNLVIRPGDVAYKDMLRGIKNGLLVHEFLGLGQGNVINGDFSANVFLGYKIENGEIVGRVKDVMLAGNAYSALKDIAALSSERNWTHGFYTGYFPYILVNKLSVTAK